MFRNWIPGLENWVLKQNQCFENMCWPICVQMYIMKNVRNWILSIETKCFGIEFQVWRMCYGESGKNGNPKLRLPAQRVVGRFTPTRPRFTLPNGTWTAVPWRCLGILLVFSQFGRIWPVWDALLSTFLPKFYKKSAQIYTKPIQNNVFLCTTDLRTYLER